VWKRVEPGAQDGFTAASELSNFPAPARTGKTAHNSHRFLMKTLLKQCSLEPQGLIFPDRRTSEIRKFKTRYMPSWTSGSTLFHTPSLSAGNILYLKFNCSIKNSGQHTSDFIIAVLLR